MRSPPIARWLLLALIALAHPARAEDLKVLRITPDGETGRGSPAQQITIAFDRAMVPLGRMERSAAEVPVTLTPDPGCEWRWLDPQVLACNLPRDAALQRATRYTVRVRPQIKALDGSELGGAIEHEFTSERPDLQYAGFADWKGPGQPVIKAWFNQPVTAASVIEALVLEESDALLAEPDLQDPETPFWTPDGEARRGWLLRPQEPLEGGTTYRLMLQPGLRSAYGEEPGGEMREALLVNTYPDFELLGISCQRGEDWSLQPLNAEPPPCEPLQGVSLAFSSPVAQASLKAPLKIVPDPIAAAQLGYDPWADADEEVHMARAHEVNEAFELMLPFQFKAEAEYQAALAGTLTDVFGRTLQQAYDFTIRTSARAPTIVFEHPRAVIESGIDSEVPVVVTNLERIDASFERMTSAGLQSGQTLQVPVSDARNVAFYMPLSARGMVGQASGAVRGGFTTVPKTAEQPQEFFALVTPWQVHAKLGHSNLVVWVTELATGRPVTDADVAVVLGFSAETRATGRTDRDGLAELPGAAQLDPKLEHTGWRPEKPLMVRVQKGADFALLPMEYDFQVDTWRASRYQVSADMRQQHGHIKSWGTTAQGVYRGGDTVQYKVYVRDEPGRALGPAPAGAYALKVYDPTGNIVHERGQVSLSAFGALDGEFKLAERAAVGWYRFELTPQFATHRVLEPLRVLVADFVPAPFRVAAELRAHTVEVGSKVDAAVRATLHAGGPFAGAAARVVARLQAAPFTSKDPAAEDFQFDSYDPDGRDFEPVADQPAQLDDKGELSQPLTVPQSKIVYGALVLEGSVQDDRGRSIASSASVPFRGRDRFVGLRYQGWMLRQGQQAEVETLVVDGGGKPVRGEPYYVTVERKQTRGARVKGAGNAYLTRYTHEWKRIATCQGRSKRKAIACAFTPDAAGQYRVTAKTLDTQKRIHRTRQWIYAEGAGEVLWEDTPDYSLDLRAERKDYESGDTARFMVKNPFPGARALVTVERFGVLDRWVETLSGAAPVIEVKIKPEYLPGFYVSVVVQSPRVEAPPAAGGRVDLGKPTFRMGYALVEVDEPFRQIEVEVKPAREEAKPRETVKVSLRAKPRHDSGQPIEFAVAVLDEAVFDLIDGGNSYFDPERGFAGLDALDLQNFSLLTRLVGRQKFEKKGANPGGDGGADLAMRSIEKFVAYWNPSLPADGKGRAEFEFTLPDNLTGWRVLALAVTPGDRFGLGQGSVKVSKLTELRPVMPNQLVAGDSFVAGFSVLNRADRERDIAVELKASGAGQGSVSKKLKLKPFERQVVTFELQAPQAGELQFSASAGDSLDRDALAHRVPVRQRRLDVTAADYGSLLAGESVTVPLRLPETAERGEVKINFSGTVLGGLDGAFDYLRDYPYQCWEQRLTKAVMAAHFVKLRARLAPGTQWTGAEELPRAMLAEATGFQAPGGGMTFWLPRDEHQSPYLSAYTSLAFGWLKDLGHEPPQAVWTKLDAYLEKILKEDLEVPGYESTEARSQVRAVALAALARQKRVARADLDRYAPLLPRMGLFGQAMFLQAALNTPGGERHAREALRLLRSRGHESAGLLLLRDDEDDAWAWLLGSEMRGNCATLSAISLMRGEAIEELPMKLARSIGQGRGKQLHWYNTQENLFCTRALIEYADRFESQPVQLTARATLGAASIGEVKLEGFKSAALTHALDAAQAGVAGDLAITTEGTGRAYFGAALSYVEKDSAAHAQDAGLRVSRRYFVRREGKWQPLEGPSLQLARGEVVKVEIEISTPVWRTYVVIDDPVPGGLEPVNPDLASSSGLDAEAMQLPGDGFPYPFYHRELRHEAVRWFADHVAAGEYRLAWIGQAIASGEFSVPSTHAEQMYDPDVFGNGVPARLKVAPAAKP